MQIQVNTDDNIESRNLAPRVQEDVAATFARFGEYITRIEVHLGDDNADKHGAGDKRCAMEARLAGRRPEAVVHHGSTVLEAYTGAARKLRKMLESSLGRLKDHKGADTIRKEGGA